MEVVQAIGAPMDARFREIRLQEVETRDSCSEDMAGIQNRELNTTEWSVMIRKVAEREQTLALSIHPDSFKALARLNLKAFWGLGRIIFRTLKDGKGEPKDENTTSKSASQ
jgi:hypothetical protein